MKFDSEKIKLIIAFAIVYFVWGSTYLAIKYVVQTMPPLTSAGIRFLLAGLILYAYKRFSGVGKPEKTHWKSASIAGGLFFLIANGGVVIASKYIDSNLVALLVALMPCWMVIIDRIMGNTKRTGWLTISGLFLGLSGLMILFNPFQAVTSDNNFNFLAGGMVVFCSFCWAIGSIYIRQAKLPESRSISASMQMISGGVMLLIAGPLGGELNNLDFAAFSAESIWAFIYLVTIGSIVAFTAFNWLLKATTSAKAGTYAYVNPVVAMILGSVIGGEVITANGIISALIIISGVVLISLEANFKKPVNTEQSAV